MRSISIFDSSFVLNVVAYQNSSSVGVLRITHARVNVHHWSANLFFIVITSMENIWNFAENEVIETDKIEMKSFKPTGKFAEDVQFLLRHFNVKCHPALREAGCSKAGAIENRDLNSLSF